MFDVGRICVKLAGRDAGKKCVVVDVKDDKVLVDGGVRRREVNPKHLLPLEESIKISKGASHEKVAEAFKEVGEVWETKKKSAAERPRKGAKKDTKSSKKKASKKTAKKSAKSSSESEETSE